MKFLIASLGDFERWRKVKYEFKGRELESRSTLPILHETINPDWTVVTVPDTVAREFTSLNALKGDIEDRVRGFLEETGIAKKVKTIIVPGVGTFQNGVFKGSAMDTYYYILHQLTEIIPPKANNTDKIEVHLDISSGLNYITLLTYRAVKEILGIVALRNEIYFRVYNSDPFVPKITELLKINIIEDIKLSPLPLDGSLPERGKYLKNHALEKREFGKILQDLKSLKSLVNKRGELNAWIASILHGLPLVFATFYPEFKEIKETINEILGTYEEYITVDKGEVVRKLSLGEGFGRLTKLAFQISVVDGLPKGEEMSYGELMTISKELFRGRNLESTKRELDKISEKVRIQPEWTKYRKFLEKQGKSPNPQVDKRNFLAHAGLEGNLIEVRRAEENEELYIRYTTEKVTYGGSKMEAKKVICRVLRDTFQ